MATIEEALAIAHDHHRSGRLEEAEIIYGRILDADPGNPRALHHLGVLAAQTGRRDRAADCIARSLERDATDPDAHFNLAALRHMERRTEEAIAGYRRALDLRPDFPDCEYHLSEALQALGRLGEALDVLAGLLGRHPGHASATRQRGDIAADLGRPGEAVSHYEAALALNPRDELAREGLAVQLEAFARRRAVLDAVGPDGRHDLSDVTFLVPFRADSPDRERNLRLIVGHLARHGTAPILVGEDEPGAPRAAQALGPELAARVRFLHLSGNDTPFTHKAHLVNRMVEAAETPIVALHDTDVVVDPVQYALARDVVRGGAAMALFYNGLFFWILAPLVERFERTPSAAFLAAVCPHQPLMHRNSPGGGGFFDRAAFLEAGGFNENFISWGYEDDEIIERLRILGHRVERVPGPLFHLDHARPVNSTEHNPFIDANRAEVERIKAMTAEALRAEVAAGGLRRPLVSRATLPPCGK